MTYPCPYCRAAASIESGCPGCGRGPDPDAAAVVRLAEGATLDPDALRAFAQDRLADYKVPVRWLVVDELPRTGTNKVKKTELAALFDA